MGSNGPLTVLNHRIYGGRFHPHDVKDRPATKRRRFGLQYATDICSLSSMNAAAALAALSLSVLTSDASTEPDACRLKVAEPFSAKSLLALKSDPVLSAYPKCVEARARTLEPSGDGLDRIASQALRACKAERAILAEAMAACGDAKFVRGAMTAEDEIVRMGVRVVVGELRAQHRSPPSENAPQAPE